MSRTELNRKIEMINGNLVKFEMPLSLNNFSYLMRYLTQVETHNIGLKSENERLMKLLNEITTKENVLV